MVKHFIFFIIYCHFNLGRDVLSQRACSEDSNVLDSCDGGIISNNNMYVDFSVIKNQCLCSFTNALNAQLIYYLIRSPGYDGCGTAIQIKEINGFTYRMPCMSSVPFLELSQSITVELVCSDPIKCGDTGYCLRILSNNASIVIHGSCQSIPVPMSSSEASIITAQSGPTHLTHSDSTHSTQRNNDQTDITAFTLDKGCVFFRNFFF